MTKTEAFPETFDALRQIMAPYEPELRLDTNDGANYSLTALPSDTYPEGLWFGGVQIKKNYVSYHLMPVYVFPDLLDDMSAGLKKRMQGKSCFNFRTPDPVLVDELSALTKAGFDRYRDEHYA